MYEQEIANLKEEILDLARKMGTSEDAQDYIDDIAIAGAKLVWRERVSEKLKEEGR